MGVTHVLVPTDFSEPANYAVQYAMEEAALHGAKVTLLHVQQSSSGTTDIYYVSGVAPSGLEAGFDLVAGGRVGAQVAEPTVVRHDVVEEALMRLRDLVPSSFKGAWDVDLAVGRPAEAIIRIAHERQVDLIIMATHGRTGLEHVLLGSVAEKVVRLAPCPVLTVKARRTAGSPPQSTT